MKDKKKAIPIIITLIAALISCVASIIEGVSMGLFTLRLLLTVVCFWIIGVIARVVIERTFKALEPEEEEPVTIEESDEVENITSDASNEEE